MNAQEKAAKRSWLKAMRSGDYKQGTYQLYEPISKSFCCLGVMQHCAMGGRVEIHHSDKFLSTPSNAFFENFPQYKWVKEQVAKLANMNDYEHQTFEQIANWVSRNWK